MFYKSKLLEELDLSNFNNKNVIDMNNMFNGCYSFKKLNFPFVKGINKVNIENIFLEYDKLECSNWKNTEQNKNKCILF